MFLLNAVVVVVLFSSSVTQLINMNIFISRIIQLMS